jgi:hypothetical protein
MAVALDASITGGGGTNAAGATTQITRGAATLAMAPRPLSSTLTPFQANLDDRTWREGCSSGSMPPTPPQLEAARSHG